MISPIYSKYLYADESRVKGVSDVNTSAVDLEKYPDVMKTRYWVGSADEGDCIYIPQMWWHQVYSRYPSFEFHDCDSFSYLSGSGYFLDLDIAFALLTLFYKIM